MNKRSIQKKYGKKKYGKKKHGKEKHGKEKHGKSSTVKKLPIKHRNMDYKPRKKTFRKKMKGGSSDYNSLLLGLLDEKYITIPTTRCLKDHKSLNIFFNSVTGLELFTLIGKKDEYVNSNTLNNLISDIDYKTKEIFKQLGSLTKSPVATKLMSNFRVNCFNLTSESSKNSSGYMKELHSYILECENHISLKDVDWYQIVMGLKPLDIEFDTDILNEMRERGIMVDTDKFKYGLDILKSDDEVREICKKRIIECGNEPRSFMDKITGSVSWNSYNNCFKCKETGCVVQLDDNYKSFLKKKHNILTVDKIKILIFMELRLRKISKYFSAACIRLKDRRFSKVRTLIKKIYNDDIAKGNVGNYNNKQLIMPISEKNKTVITQKGGVGSNVDSGNSTEERTNSTSVDRTESAPPDSLDFDPENSPYGPPGSGNTPEESRMDMAKLEEAEREEAKLEQAEQEEAKLEQAEQEEAKQGEAVQGEAEQGEAAQGEAVQGEAAQGEAVQGEAGVSEAGVSEAGVSEAGVSEAGVSEAIQGEAIQGEAMQGEAIQGEAMQGEAKQGEAGVSEEKQGEAGVSEEKQGEAMQGEAKQGEAKPEEINNVDPLSEKTVEFSKMFYISYNGIVKSDKVSDSISKQVSNSLREVCKLTNKDRLKVYRVRIGPRTVSIEIGIEDPVGEELPDEEIKANIVKSIVDKEFSKKMVVIELDTVKDIYFDGISKYEELKDYPSQHKRVLLEMEGRYPKSESGRIPFETKILNDIKEFLEEPDLDLNRIQLENITDIPNKEDRVFVQFVIMNGIYEKKTPHEIIKSFKEKYEVDDGNNEFTKKYKLENAVFGEPSVILDNEDIEKMKSMSQEKNEFYKIDRSTFDKLESDYKRLAYFGCDKAVKDISDGVIMANTPLNKECEEDINKIVRGY